MLNSVPIYTIHNAFDVHADPVHFPITIGNEQFIITQQDQRSILDRRTWFLSSPAPSSSPPNLPAQQRACLFELQQILQQLLAISPARQHFPSIEPAWVFRYEKQTSTDDLPYFARMSGLDRIKPSEAGPVVKHVHFVVDRTSRQDTGVNTDSMQQSTDERMECGDPREGSSGNLISGSRSANAYDLMKHRKEQEDWFW